MQIVRDYRRIPDALKGAVIAIGNFDGLHPGHQAVIAKAAALAKHYQAPLVVFTFEPHPRRVFQPDVPLPRLMPFHLKMRGLQALGVQGVVAQRFHAPFRELSASAFIEQVLVQTLAVRGVVTGEGFVFGHQRSGSVDTLKDAATRYGFDYQAVPIHGFDAVRYASRAIRTAVTEGGWAAVYKGLGRSYGWMCRVIHGEKRGRTIGFPTLNMQPPAGAVCPPYGVYAVRVWDVAAQEAMDGVANWGVRPTFGVHKPLLEVHLMGRSVDLYGARLYVEWVAPIRGEQRFDGVDALCRQIAEDCKAAQAMLAQQAPAVWLCAAG